MDEITCPFCGFTGDEDEFDWDTGYLALCLECGTWFDVEEE